MDIDSVKYELYNFLQCGGKELLTDTLAKVGLTTQDVKWTNMDINPDYITLYAEFFAVLKINRKTYEAELALYNSRKIDDEFSEIIKEIEKLQKDGD